MHLPSHLKPKHRQFTSDQEFTPKALSCHLALANLSEYPSLPDVAKRIHLSPEAQRLQGYWPRTSLLPTLGALPEQARG